MGQASAAPAPSSAAAAPTPAPIAAKTQSSMQASAKDKTSSKDDLVSVVRAILDLIRGMDRVELAEAA